VQSAPLGLISGADKVKTQKEVPLYGRTAEQTYDPNYRTDRDILVNYNVGVGLDGEGNYACSCDLWQELHKFAC
jgi:hypothetical protein